MLQAEGAQGTGPEGDRDSDWNWFCDGLGRG